jgi:hypothetical protein
MMMTSSHFAIMNRIGSRTAARFAASGERSRKQGCDRWHPGPQLSEGHDRYAGGTGHPAEPGQAEGQQGEDH